MTHYSLKLIRAGLSLFVSEEQQDYLKYFTAETDYMAAAGFETSRIAALRQIAVTVILRVSLFEILLFLFCLFPKKMIDGSAPC